LGFAFRQGSLEGEQAAMARVRHRGKVIHAGLVPEIAQEPDYDAARAALE